MYPIKLELQKRNTFSAPMFLQTAQGSTSQASPETTGVTSRTVASPRSFHLFFFFLFFFRLLAHHRPLDLSSLTATTNERGYLLQKLTERSILPADMAGPWFVRSYIYNRRHACHVGLLACLLACSSTHSSAEHIGPRARTRLE